MFKYGSEVVIYVLHTDVCANEDSARSKYKKKKGETLARTGHAWFRRVSCSGMCSTMSTITWDICASRSDLAVTRDVVIVTVLAAGVLSFCEPRGLK